MTDNKSPQIDRFNNVDATGEAERFIAFLEWVENLPPAIELRKRSYELLDAHSGDTVIDVGCGTGKVVSELADHELTVIGVDVSQQMISVAGRRFPSCDFRTADAEVLPFQDGAVTHYRAERLYQHLKNPARALAEAKRVLAPGGRIVLLDQDYDMWAIDADDKALTRAVMRAHADTIVSRWIGRSYHNLLLDSGFVDVVVEVKTLIYTDYAQVAPILPSIVDAAVTAGAINHDHADEWLAEQNHRGKVDRFFMAMPLFMASAVNSDRPL